VRAPPRESDAGRTRKTAAIVLACAAGLALFATIAYWALHPPVRPGVPKIVIDGRDEVYYSHAATQADAESLGRALRLTGFFNGRGTAVMLSKGAGGTFVSFVLSDNAWNHPGTVSSFEEIARRVAGSIGGFPIHLRLSDAKWGVHKELVVGKVTIGARDEVYYYGSATALEAEALGRALKSAGYLVDAGASVVLSKDGVTVISFVLGEGALERPGTVTGFENLARHVAASVGGLPIGLRLLNSQMEVEKEIAGLH
jgi:hypothetical protein